MGAPGIVSNITAGLDGPPTAVMSSANPKVETVLFEGKPATSIGAPIVPHKRHGSKRVHSSVVAIGAPTILVGGVSLAFATLPPTPTIQCGDGLAVGQVITCEVNPS